MSAKERRKGHNFERLIAARFREFYPDSKRVLEYQEGKTYDVRSGPYVIQCKKTQNYASINRLLEVNKDDGIPMLATAGRGKPAVVCLYLEDFMGLMETVERK